MYNYKKESYEQQIEIMRRCTANALDVGDVWCWDEGCKQILKDLFLTHHGITEIAYFFNITEVEVMRAVLEFRLYDCYAFPPLHRWCGDDENEPETPKGESFNSDPLTRAIEMMRRDTRSFDESLYNWTEDRVKRLRMKFYLSEGISQIALALGCTEPMVVNKILEERLYHCMDYPFFAFCQ